MRQKGVKKFLSTLLVSTLVVTTGVLGAVQEATAADRVEWRPLIKRSQGELGADKVDYPQYYTKGRYGSEGYQYIQGAAVQSDGTVLMGQDMGSARISLDFGKTWFTPPNTGNPLIVGNSCAIDPADSDVMFIAMAAGSMGTLFPVLRNQEGIYRSTDKGQNWTLVQSIPNISSGSGWRFYKDNFACYPVTGGTAEARTWRFVNSDREGGPGTFWTSSNGITWTKKSDLSFSTYGKKYALVQHPTVQNTLYLCTETGLWCTPDGGGSWTRPWNSKIPGKTRSLWIDPDNTSHMIASVTDTGVWETVDGNNWTCILNSIQPATLAVGAKNSDGKRLIYVHNDAGDGKAWIRKFDGTWSSSYTIQANNPDVWHQKSITGQDQCVFLPHPTIPDLCITHGRNFWWRSEGTEGMVWTDGSTNFFGSSMNSTFFDEENWQKIDFACQDSGTSYTSTGGDWMSLSNITGKEAGGQWARMIAVTGDAGDLDARSGRAIVRLPDPWPTGVPAPANSNVPGRRILSLGGTVKHFIFTQNKNQMTWNDWIEQDVTAGGYGIKRNFAFYSRQNPNIVYVGPNVSTDGGTTWGITNGQREIFGMSYLNGDIVYTIQKDGTEYKILKSTNKGQSWQATPVLTTTYSIVDAVGIGRLAADPNSDDRLYTNSSNRDVLLVKKNGSAWDTVNLNLRSQFSNPPVDWAMKQVCVDWSDSRLIYVLLNISGKPSIWRGRLNSDFTACTWEDITLNAPRIAMSTGIEVDPVTGDLLYNSGNGNFVLPAPSDWQHKDPAKRQYKSALWNNLPRPIPNSILYESFDGMVSGVAPTAWAVTGDVKVEKVPSATDKSMKLNDSVSTGLSAVRDFSPQTGAFTVEYRFKISSGTNFAGLQLEDGNAVSAIMVKVKDGAISYKNSSGTWMELQTCTPETWYTIRVEGDVATGTCSLYINNVEKLTGQAFTGVVSSVSELNFVTGGSYTGVLNVDNVRISVP